jgi:hypothetical protein
MRNVFVPKEFIMVPGTFVGARFNDLGMVFSNVVKGGRLCTTHIHAIFRYNYSAC